MLTTKEILTEARNLILLDGWIQNQYSNDQGYCIVGALKKVLGDALHEDRIRDDEVSDLFWESSGRICDVLRSEGRITSPASFNDAPTRTRQDVLDLLEEAASGV